MRAGAAAADRNQRGTPPPPVSRLWLLRVVLPGRWGRWLTGLLIFAVLLTLFVLLGGLLGAGSETGRINAGVALFFCIILGYIVPIHHLIIERFNTALAQLEIRLDVTSTTLAAWRSRIEHKPRAWTLITLAIGIVAGGAHNLLLIAPGGFLKSLSNIPALLSIFTTALIWIVMTGVISSLLDSALLFRRAARRARIDLLDMLPLTPFGSVAVSSTLAMIGAQAAFPAMMLQRDLGYMTYVPGLVATGVPMIFLFLLPVLPLHRRIVSAKRDALKRISGVIAELPVPEDSAHFQDVSAVLTYRREIASASEWPFDTSVIGRLGIYLIIPPLTWIGAALIEMLLDALL